MFKKSGYLKRNYLFPISSALVLCISILGINDRLPVDFEWDTSSESESDNEVSDSELDNNVTTEIVPLKSEVSTAESNAIHISNDNNTKRNADNNVEEEIVEEDVPQAITGKEALDIISNSVVSNSSGFSINYKDTKNVFAEEYDNTFSFRTAVSYNMWGGNMQDACFSAKHISKHGSSLNLTLGVLSGGTGDVSVDIYTTDSDNPQSFLINSEQPGIPVSINLLETDTIKIEIDNLSSEENEVVFYDITIV